jgi:hypothetical protein
MDGYMEDKKIVHLADITQHRRADGFKNISGNWCACPIWRGITLSSPSRPAGWLTRALSPLLSSPDRRVTFGILVAKSEIREPNKGKTKCAALLPCSLLIARVSPMVP